MNCKPGDLAVVVHAAYTKEMIGRFVIIERPAMDHEFTSPDIASGPTWIVRSASVGLLPVRWPTGRFELHETRPYFDGFLRPIRPNEGEDESLSWEIRTDQREFVQQK